MAALENSSKQSADIATIEEKVALEFVEKLKLELANGVEVPRSLIWIALLGRLDLAPPEVLTEKALLQTESEGFNCLHHAASKGCLLALPEKFRTDHYYNIADQFGRTVFHYAAEGGHLDQIPAELLTDKNLLALNCWGYSALQLAVEQGCLHQIPAQLATQEHLTAAAAHRQRYILVSRQPQ